jgi:hypothetical protein
LVGGNRGDEKKMASSMSCGAGVTILKGWRQMLKMLAASMAVLIVLVASMAVLIVLAAKCGVDENVGGTLDKAGKAGHIYNMKVLKIRATGTAELRMLLWRCCEFWRQMWRY